MKFVSEKEPRHQAERLHKLQDQIEARRAELAALEKEAKQLQSYLLKVGKGKTWAFNGSLYKKQVIVSHNQRMILDQDECKRRLKSKTPYKPLDITKVRVDYIYED